MTDSHLLNWRDSRAFHVLWIQTLRINGGRWTWPGNCNFMGFR